MGLIKAISGAIRSTLADQWLDYFYCDSIPVGTLVVKGQKRQNSGTHYATSNTRDSEDIITKNSVIAVNEGQAMLVVDNGRIVDFTCEPGAFTFESTGMPSMFAGDFGQGLKDSFSEIKKRFTYGGGTSTTQRVYYINLKEITGNRFASSQPISYDDPYYETVLYLNYFGSYSFKITDPLRFFSAISGNVTNAYTVAQLAAQTSAEFYMAMDTAMNQLCSDGVKFSKLPSKQKELSQYMEQALDEEWQARRGLDIIAVGIEKIVPDENSRQRIETFDNATMLGRSGEAMQGRMASAQASAFENMGNNPNGTSGMDMFGVGVGMMGINMMNNMGQNQGQQQPPAMKGWVCPSCGHRNELGFCAQCGEKRPTE